MSRGEDRSPDTVIAMMIRRDNTHISKDALRGTRKDPSARSRCGRVLERNPDYISSGEGRGGGGGADL
ncbi:hypothetical protein EYF80_008842 [Liparis tanakae]|uniref:Uncharacterized protein n=1 Tax=Liparis tanakae TaxID=230148 RepID=A0A4Z2ISU1_9TELE|nr:hypothetical protein EYF80_008842 [Liparis tanakae]